MSALATVLRVIVTVIDVIIGVISVLGARTKPGAKKSDPFVVDVLMFIAVSMVANIIVVWSL